MDTDDNDQSHAAHQHRAQRNAAVEANYYGTRASATAALATGRQRCAPTSKLRRLAHYIDVLDASYAAFAARETVDARLSA